jgi:uncharacterized protein YjbI with pentapeptide repeats
LTKPKRANEYSPPYHALRDLGVVGAQLERADLRGRSLRGVNFTNANLRGADLSESDLSGANFTRADLSRANLHMANCRKTSFAGADLTMSYARGTLFFECNMSYSMLRRVTWKNCFVLNCNLEGADVAQAFLVGTRFNGSITTDMKNVDRAVFVWYLRVGGGPPKYEPDFQYRPYTTSVTGSLTFQENSARRRLRE